MAKISTYPIISIPTIDDLLIGTDVNDLNNTKNFTIGEIGNLIGQDYVPYVGATGNVNLGSFNITGGGFIVGGGTASQFLKADGSLDSTLYTPQIRTLTINGTTYNLSANRSWDLNTIDSLTTNGTSGAATYVGKVLNIPVYQAQGSYITQLSGEATGSGPGNASVTLSNSAVISKVLTGLNVTGGTVVSTDTILQAFGKIQNQINGLAGGVEYQGVWNAATNTPTLQSSVGTQGYYYVVDVAGNTNLNGITDWQVGDWAIYNGSVWQKVDNTDAVVSVNGYVGAVVLTASDVGAVPTTRTLTINGVGYNLSADRAWTVGDVRTDGSYANPSWITSLGWSKITGTPTTLAGYGITDGALNTTTLTINGTTYDLTANRTWNVGTVTSVGTSGPLTGGTITGSGTIGITQSSSTTDGYLSSADWNAFNSKQGAISVTAPITLVSGVIGITQSGASSDGYLSSTDWNTFNSKVSGSGTANTLPMWGSASSLINSPLSYALDTFNFQYNSATGGTVNFTNIGLTAYTYSIQMNNFGSPRSTIHSYTDGLIIQSIGGTQVSRMFANGNLILGTGTVDNGYKLEVTGDLYLSSIVNATVDTDRFIVSDGGLIKYRTGAQVLSDIGAQGALTLTTIGSSGPATLISNTLNIPDYGSVLTGYVPYTGATQNVNLGEFGISAGYFQADLSPTQAAGVGRLIWNNTDGTLNLGLIGGNVQLHIGQQQYARIVNGTGGNVLRSNYQAVKIIGAQGQRMQVGLARADNDFNSKDTLGLIAENINNNNEGFVISSGLIEEINTTGSLQGETWLDGDTLYLSGTIFGALTNVKPIAPIHTVIVGFVVYSHANHGKIFVKVDNGYELEELHDVNPLPYVNNGVLYRDTTLNLWKSATIPTLLGYTPANAATTITINGTTFDLSANRTWSVGTVTSVAALTLGTSGTDLSSTVSNGTTTPVITLNVPTASATNRGALSAADWSTFNAKQNALTLTTAGSSGASTLVGATLNVPTYTLSGLGGVPTSRQLTINGTAFDLSADRSWNVGTVTSVGLSSATSGVTIGSTPVIGSGTITLAIATANATQQGLLSSADWSTFNAKQNALTLTTTGTSGAATLVGATLNIPQYQAAGTYVTSVTASSPLASSGGTTPNITIQQATATQNGFLSSTDWSTFNNKANANGSNASGTWGISITGSAGSAGSASTASLVNGTSGGAIQSWDIRTIAPSSMTAYRLGFGFTSWANNNSAPYADYLHLRSYSDGSGGADNLVMFLKSGIGMRIYQQTFGSSSPYSSYADVLLSTNYSSYALPLSGGTLTGPVSLSDGSYFRGSPSYGFRFNNNADTINSLIVDNSGNSIAYASHRAPIFYDSNNTAYYVDPSSTSTSFNSVGTGNFGNGASDTGLGVYFGSGSSDYGRIRFYQAGTNTQTIHVFSSAWQGGTLASTSTGAINLNGSNGVTLGPWNVINSSGHWFDNSGNGQSSGSFRSPIFYDSNNTTYYLDAASSGTSLNINGGISTTASSGSILLRHPVSEANAWLFMENAPNWGLFWFNDGTQSGQTIGSYTTIGAELFGMNNAVGGFNPNSAWTGTDANTRATWMLSNYTGYIWSNSTIFAAGDMRTPIFYDSNDTGYFGDFNGISSLWGIAIRGDNGSTSTTNQIFFWGGGNTTTSAIGFKANGGSFTNPTGSGDGYNTYLTMDTPGRGWVFREGVGGTNFNAAYTSGWILNNGTWQANSSMRAPIFYDSNNTAHYVDAAGTSVLNLLTIYGGNSYGATYFVSNLGGYSGSLSGPPLQAYSTGNNSAFMSFHKGGNYAVNMGLDADNVLRIGGWSAAANRWQLDMSGNVYVAGSSRAPIFYDLDNTAFYFDGASTTNINVLHGNGKEVMLTSDSYLRINQSATFSGGTWFGGTLIRTDGFYAGSNGGTTTSRVAIQSGSYNGTNVINIDGSNGRITASELLLGGAASGFTLNLAGNAQIVKSTTSTALIVGLSGVTGSVIRFSYNGGFVGSISTDGSNTAYNTSSDYRLKEEIVPIENPVSKILSLNPVNFKYKNSKTIQDGFLAHELQEVLPYLVVGEKDAVDDDGNPVYQEVDYSKLTPILIAAIKELKTEIETLKTKQ